MPPKNSPGPPTRRALAREKIEAGGKAFPDYGTPEHEALDMDDPRRDAGTYLFAECWFYERAHMVSRLRADIEAGREERLQSDAEDFAETAAIIRRDANRPSFAELSDRRGEHDRAEHARSYGAAMRAGWQR